MAYKSIGVCFRKPCACCGSHRMYLPNVRNAVRFLQVARCVRSLCRPRQTDNRRLLGRHRPENEMSERRTEVKTFRVDYICDTCGKGIMCSTGVTLMSNPPQYPHMCLECDATQTFTGITYPRLEHEDAQEQCFYCGQWFPRPVSYHHSEEECREHDAV